MTKVLFIDFNICPYFFVRTYMTAFQYEYGVNEKCAPSVLYTFDHSITMQAMKEKVEEKNVFFFEVLVCLLTLPSSALGSLGSRIRMIERVYIIIYFSSIN